MWTLIVLNFCTIVIAFAWCHFYYTEMRDKDNLYKMSLVILYSLKDYTLQKEGNKENRIYRKYCSVLERENYKIQTMLERFKQSSKENRICRKFFEKRVEKIDKSLKFDLRV